MWLRDESPGWIALLLFGPFAFVWVHAALGLQLAPDRLRTPAFRALLRKLTLNYVRNPERALATTFFVVVPLAVVFLVQAQVVPALLAAVTNGLCTITFGLSTGWLPPSRVLAIPVTASGLAIWSIARRSDQPPAHGNLR